MLYFNNMRKKIVDCIIFNGNLGLLNFRIKEVINLVDIIYIIFHGQIKKHELLSDAFLYKEIDKIKILESDIEIVDGFMEIKELLSKEELNFDNIISISTQYELPNYKEYTNIIEELSFSPVILLQKKYTWSLDYYEENLHKGTKVFLYTDFFKFNSFYFNGPRKKIAKKLYETYENGWSFFGFDIDNYELKSNLLPLKNISKFETKPLIKSVNDNQFNHIYDFIEKKEIKLRDKKVFYIGDTESDIIFNERMIFIMRDALSFKSEFNEIYIPNYNLYESNNFKIEYFLNEVRKYMSILFPLPHDEIVFNFEFMRESKKVLWEKVENSNLLELLLN